MRVTNSMIANRISYNTQAALQRFLETQTQMSSGRRINAPSDDPIGTLRDLDYRKEISKNEQYQKNISMAENWVQTYDNVLDSMNQIANSARELSVTMADASVTSEARKGAVSELEPMIEQLLQIANDQQEGRYIFSGFKTDQKAFQRYANGFRYLGDSGKIQYKIDSSTLIDVNLIGSDVLLKPVKVLGEEADFNVILNGSTLLRDLHNGDGIDMTSGQIQIRDLNMGIDVTVDLSGAATIDDVISTINNELTANGITNLSVSIGLEKNNLLFTPTDTGIISTATSIDKLNSGYGIDVSIGDLVVTDGGVNNASVDLDGVTNVGDIISRFNASMTASGINNVSMQLNAAGTGLEIVDSNVPPLGLSVTDTTGQNQLASSLGIEGAIDPVLIGEDLDPVVSFKIEEVGGGSTASDLGILNSFSGNYVGADLDPRLLLTSSVNDLFSGSGIPSGEISVWQGDVNRTIDLSDPTILTVQDVLDAFNNSGLDITATLNPDSRGIQVVNNDETRSFTIEDMGVGRVAKDMGIFGSSDMVGSLFVLQNSLGNDHQEEVGLLLDNFDQVINHLLNTRAEVGTRGIRMETTMTRLVDQNLTFTERLAEIEDADLTKVITDLSTMENNYQAALLASAKIIQPTLLNFLD